MDIVAQGAYENAARLHDYVIRAILERLFARFERTGQITFTATDKWQIESLQQSGMLLKDINKEIAKLTGVQAKEIRNALKQAGIESLKTDALVYAAAGLPDNVTLSPAMARIAARQYEATYGRWLNYTRTTALAAQNAFYSECDRAYNEMITGAFDYSTAVKGAISRIASTGLETIAYNSGHKDTIEVATLRAVRTSAGQTASEITATRAAEMGIYLFLTSAHIGARPTHYEWQGKVFWVDWDRLSSAIPINVAPQATAPDEIREKYPEFVATTGIGTVTGLCGANCRHSYSPYIEGVSYSPFPDIDKEENAKRYANSQKARRMERAIRKSKRELMGYELALPAGDPAIQAAYDKTLAKVNRQTSAYYAFMKEAGLKPAEINLYTGE